MVKGSKMSLEAKSAVTALWKNSGWRGVRNEFR